MYRVSVRILGLCFAILAAVAVAGAQSRTRPVIESGQAAPGGGVFAPSLQRMIQKGIPVINNTTIVVGTDVVLNGQTTYSIFTENNRTLRVVTRVGAPAPGGGTIQDISYFTADGLGNVFLVVRTTDGTAPDAIVRYSYGVLSLVARTGQSLPNGQSIGGVGVAAAPDGLGGIYFQATYGADGEDSALVHWRPNTMDAFELVAATGMPAPSGGTFAGISPATITSTASGLVAFASTVNGGPAGIFSGLAGNLVLASDAVDAIPNITVADNDDVEVSYMQPSSPGIKMTTLAGTTTFVTNGTAAPRSTGTINFGQFQIAMAADREGSLYFFAPISGDSSRGAGLFRRDRFTNQITSIALQADPAQGSIGGSLGLFALATNVPARIANDDGKVVFAASAGLDSSKVGVFTTLNAPEGLVPTVAAVVVKKNKITVTGGGFESGARILVNGNPLSDSKNNKKDPTHKLQSKTGGSQIAPGATVSVVVANPSGVQSTPFTYTRPR